jgi:transglutaminase-like putative cysteine protease
VVQEIEISGLAGPWLPAAYEPVRVDDLDGVGADGTTRTLISPNDLRDGTKYTVTSRLPRLTYTELDLVPPPGGDDPALFPYLDLPTGVHSSQIERVAEITRSVVNAAGASDEAPFRQAVALQRYLRTFTYDENVANGHSIDTIEDFLDRVKRGYCEQFATAMAVMARTLGLPSRVAIGFAGGTLGTEPDEVTVTTRNAHAWVEIFFAPYGWVQFEPTPRSDSVVVPGYTSPASTSPTTPEIPATESPEPTPTDTATTGRTAPEPELEGGVGTTLAGRLVPVGMAAGGLLLLLLIAFPIAARVRRLLRRRRARTPTERIAVRYLDFLDWCASAGIGRAAAETPIEHARRLAGPSSKGPSNGSSVELLARQVVNAVYAPSNGADPDAVARLARSARAAVNRTLSRRTLVLTTLGWGWWRTDPSSRQRIRGLRAG